MSKLSRTGVPCTLRTGEEALIRPITPADAIRLVQFHERLSNRTQYQRFLAAHPHLTGGEIERFTTVDHADREAFVAVVDDRIIAVGRWDRIEAGLAEVAFVVADEYQHLGLGSVLFTLLAEAAIDHGIDTFTAEMLPQNRAMRRLFEVFGDVVERETIDGVTTMSVRLTDLGKRHDS